MASSALVAEALSGLFDDRPEPVVVVSGYDEVILYANPAFARLGHRLGSSTTDNADTAQLLIDVIGRSIREILALYGQDFDDSPIRKALSTGCYHGEQVPDTGYFRCGSVLPLHDISRTAIGSIHAPGLTAEQVELRHVTLQIKAAVALEFMEAERLIQVGMEALHRSRQRIHRLQMTLQDSQLAKYFPTD